MCFECCFVEVFGKMLKHIPGPHGGGCLDSRQGSVSGLRVYYGTL